MSRLSRIEGRIYRTRRRIADFAKKGWTPAVKRAKRYLKRLKSVRKRLRRQQVNWNGHPPIRGATIRKAIRIANRYGLVVTSTTGGTHSPTSWHYQGRAVDLASGSVSQMRKAQHAIYREIPTNKILELFGPANSPWVKNGSQITGAEGSFLENQHDNHVHFAA